MAARWTEQGVIAPGFPDIVWAHLTRRQALCGVWPAFEEGETWL